MFAMVLEQPRTQLKPMQIEKPTPGANQVLLRVKCCAVCRTDLHIVDGELSQPTLPLVLGHEIVGTVEAAGESVTGFTTGQRVGVPWLGSTCGACEYCQDQQENLCDQAVFTGYNVNGGYAQFAVADAHNCFKLPEGFSDAAAAPLLCAGMIGWRAYKLVRAARRLGIYGFGAAAHILTQVAIYEGMSVYAFTRPGDSHGQVFAEQLGATWAGSSEDEPPEPLDAAIICAPSGELVPVALKAVSKGGIVVCGGIHMSDIPSFPYDLLWGERSIHSVANLTRADAEEFLEIAPRVPVKVSSQLYALSDANRALDDLRTGKLDGAAVLVP